MQARASLLIAVVGLLPSPAFGAERVEFTLPNGLRVRLAPAKDEPRVAVILGVRAGFLEEPKGVPHLAHVTEHLTVFDLKGPRERQAVERWFPKGQANGETLGELMYFDLHVDSAELSDALRVQAARLGAVEYSRATLAREIPRTLQEIEFLEKSTLGSTGKFALAPFVQAALHGVTDVPIKARTQKINVEEVQAFHTRTFRPDRAMLIVIGDFDAAATRKEIEGLFGPIRRPEAKPAPRPTLKPGTHKAAWDVPTRHLMLAWPLPRASDRDRAALSVAGFVLPMRLWALKGRLGLSKFPLVDDASEGVFLINMQLDAGCDAEAVRKAILAEVEALTGKLTDLDVRQARNGLAMLTEMKVDANTALPPHVTRTLARANVELQRLMREIVWGDLPAYLARMDKLDGAAARAAVTTHLAVEKATVVYIEPR